MNQVTEVHENPNTPQPPPLKISRTFHAPRKTVFNAWGTSESVSNWFSPETYTAPKANVDMRVGGAFDVCMRSPEGTEHWTRGKFVEVTPHTRLVIDMHAVDDSGQSIFRAYTEVDFSDALGGTQMDVTQTYTFANPAMAAPMVSGAPEGWRTTLDKFEREVIRLQGGTDTGVTSVVHDTFSIERTYDAPVARVWTALTTEAAKQKWFAGTPGRWELIERSMDVRPGGRERLKGRWEGGLVSDFNAIYHDVIPNERLVYTYEIHMDDKKISISLATLQLNAEDGKTTLTVTEQGAFLDGYVEAGSREQGTRHLLDALGVSLKS